MLIVVCCLLCVVCWLLFGVWCCVRWSVFAVCCLMCLVRWSLCVVRCLRFAASCSVLGVRRRVLVVRYLVVV